MPGQLQMFGRATSKGSKKPHENHENGGTKSVVGRHQFVTKTRPFEGYFEPSESRKSKGAKGF
jgi:hypothetical protein